MATSANQVIDSALSKGAAGGSHDVDLQHIKDRERNRNPRSNDASAPFIEALEINFLDGLKLQERFL